MDLDMMAKLVKTFLCTGNDNWLDREVDGFSEASFYSRVRASLVFCISNFNQHCPFSPDFSGRGGESLFPLHGLILKA